jgi:hypothetical protein
MKNTKICSICKIEQDINSFHKNKNSLDGYKSKCKECRKQESKERYLNNIEYFEKYRKENRDKINGKLTEWRKNNPKYRREYYEKNYEKEITYSRIKSKENKEYFRNWTKDKYKTDILFSLKMKLNGRLRKVLKRNNLKKNYKFCDILGCSLEEFKLYFESKFTEGMSWDLMGKEIHIDHIIPCASAKTEEEMIKLFHYTNLQPLWAKDNMSKSDKIL